MTNTSHPTTYVPAAVLAWLFVAVALGAAGVLQQLRPPAPQIVLAALTLASVGALWLIRSVRTWAMLVDLRWFVAFHLVRFVGIYFLVLYGRGELPYAFAVPGGWGDIGVAAFAAVLLLTGPPHGRRRGIYQLWNVVGLIDILFVVATATRLGLANPESMAALLRLPLSLLPTFVVPIVIASHLWLFRRLIQRDEFS